MSLVEKIGIALVLAFVALSVLKMLKGPVKIALKLLINTALGFAAVWLLNATTAYTGLSLGLNWCNALTVGVLGAPGFILLLLLQWVLA